MLRLTYPLATLALLAVLCSAGTAGAGDDAEVNALVDGLRSSDAMVRRQAALQAADLGPRAKAAASVLASSLQSEDGVVRSLAAIALRGIGYPGMKHVAPLVKARDGNTRRAALFALVGSQGAALPHLLGAAEHPDPKTREAARRALFGLGPDAVPAMEQAWRVAEPQLRVLLARSLLEQGEGGSSSFLRLANDREVRWDRDADTIDLEAAREVWRQHAQDWFQPIAPYLAIPLAHAVRDSPQGIALLVRRLIVEDERSSLAPAAMLALESVGKPALRTLLAALDDASGLGAYRAAIVVARIGGAHERLVPLLTSAMHDGGWRMQSAAVEALGQTHDRAALQVLLKQAEAGQERSRAEACRALGDLGLPEAVPALARLTAASDPDVAAAATEALGTLGEAAAPALQALIDAARHERWDVRRAAEYALSRVPFEGHEDAIATTLVERLGDRWISERRAAASGLGAMGDRAVPALVRALRAHPDENVRKGAAYALWWLGASAAGAESALVAALRDESVGVRASAARVLLGLGQEARQAGLPGLRTMLRGDTDADRRMVVWHLWFYGLVPAELATDLIRLLDATSADLRLHAWLALGSLGTQLADHLEELLPRVGDWRSNEHGRTPNEYALLAIGGAGERAVPGLIQALAKGGDQALYACWGIAHIGPFAESAVGPLRELLRGADVRKRWAAALALGRIGPLAAAAKGDLLHALADDDHDVRVTAAFSLRQVAGNGLAIEQSKRVSALIAEGPGGGLVDRPWLRSWTLAWPREMEHSSRAVQLQAIRYFAGRAAGGGLREASDGKTSRGASEILARLLQTGDEEIASAAEATILARGGFGAAELREALRHPGARLRGIRIAARYGDRFPQGVPILLGVLREGPGPAWQAALDAVQGMPRQRAAHIDDLLRMLGSDVPGLGLAAARLLADLPELALRVDRVEALLRATDGRTVARALALVPALGEMGLALKPELLKFLQSQDREVAQAAAVALGRLGGAAVPELVHLADTADPRVRLLAIRGLGEAGWAARGQLPRLARLLLQGTREERAAAEAALIAMVP